MMCLIGCIAEVKKVKWQRDGTCHALTRGRQRVAFCPASNQYGAATCAKTLQGSSGTYFTACAACSTVNTALRNAASRIRQTVA